MTLAQHAAQGLQGLGLLLGLNGVILLAYVIAIPANELVIPSILLLTVHLAAPNRGVILFELDDPAALHQLLTTAGWTFVTGLNLMLFSLLHNPCSTTLYTIYKETNSWRWTALSALIPLVLGVLVCGAVAWALG
jgi:ferrous iron transport protein B